MVPDLINLGKLSKPATVLIEKVSSAIGFLYEPNRIKRKAKACKIKRFLITNADEWEGKG